jgi:hypothetical protein
MQIIRHEGTYQTGLGQTQERSSLMVSKCEENINFFSLVQLLGEKGG